MEHTLSNVIHDPELPRKMLDQLAELMRADCKCFDHLKSLQEIRRPFSIMNGVISWCFFYPEDEATTWGVTQHILNGLRIVVDQLGLGKVRNMTQEPEI